MWQQRLAKDLDGNDNNIERSKELIIRENKLGLSPDTAELMIVELDKYVSTFFTILHQYYKHYWLVKGPQFRDIRNFLKSSFNDVQVDLDGFAERITILGGRPTCRPDIQYHNSLVDHEKEGEFRVRTMLENDALNEGTIACQLRITVRKAYHAQDFGTESLVRGVLVKSEKRIHFFDHILSKDSLLFGVN